MSPQRSTAPEGAALPPSVFAGIDVCRAASLPLTQAARRPLFDDDVWNLDEVVGTAVALGKCQQRLDFRPVTNPRWRQVAKEYLFALLAPHHEHVRVLPHAYRVAFGLQTCTMRLLELARFFRWLAEQGVEELAQLDQSLCDGYLNWRREIRGEDNEPIRQAQMVHYQAALVMIDIAEYSELFTADRCRLGWRPWPGKAAAEVAGVRTNTGENKTPPLPMETLRPLLSAALYIVDTLGPHILALRDELVERTERIATLRGVRTCPTDKLLAALDQQLRDGEPFVERLGSFRARKLSVLGGPLDDISFAPLAHAAGARQFCGRWLDEQPVLRNTIENALAVLGTAKPLCRNAALVPRADDGTEVPWTEPLHYKVADDLPSLLRIACLLVVAILTGMRRGELMELRRGCPTEEDIAPGLKRYRLQGKVIKGRALGGEPEEWVVIPEAHRAAAVAEKLIGFGVEGARRDTDHLFGRFSHQDLVKRFLSWVNGPAGNRLGLQPVPAETFTLRMLRRRLAIELAYRPAGLLAAKVQLKHVSVVTTEGYAARPGGAQAKLWAEVSQHEQSRNIDLTVEAFADFERGVMPAGPGARELIDYFGSIDAQLGREQASPKVLGNDQQLRNLLSRRAKTLHLGVANYCWFSDPSRALCLKIAGTPTADKPMIGMCDAARCPQATHHARHRDTWSEAVQSTTTFLGSLSKTQKTERQRLQFELSRAQRVIDGIDAASSGAQQDH
ncbi:site-specific integrase [Mycolicibacterium mageritense]|uniref:site-specific integrase n=1 Tax=Mycolicibacterium mageritense TaxID=53462 RepID=UPI0011D422EE|nr:site-specific integrase [Mycolicibacterium mageritense]TXI51959.1 MAG: site-specific integrase [Mycolicibacterium mageritense]